MFFALGMERVEARLRQVAVGENDVEEFLEQARPNEVRELFKYGIGRALELFRRRRRTPPRRAALAPGAGRRGAEVTAMPVAARQDERVPAPQPRSRQDESEAAPQPRAS